MKKYKVKLTYPTILVLKDTEYVLWPKTIIELPDHPFVETYVGLNYLKPLPEKEKKEDKKGGE